MVAHYPPHMQADIAACSVPSESSTFNSGSVGSLRSLLVPTAENDAEAFRQDAVRLGLRDPRQQGVDLGAAALPGVDVGGGGGGGGAHGADGGRGAGSAVVTLELPAGLPRNGLVVLECKVGRRVWARAARGVRTEEGGQRVVVAGGKGSHAALP